MRVKNDRLPQQLFQRTVATACRWLGVDGRADSDGRRRERALLFLWIGLLFPLFLAPVRTRTGLLSDAITPLELVRGTVPIACLCIALLLAWPGIRPVSRTEVLLGAFLTVSVLSASWSVAPWATILKAGSLVVAYVTLLAMARHHGLVRRPSLGAIAVLVQTVVFLVLSGLLVMPDRAMAPLSKFDSTPRLQGIVPPIAADFVGYFAVLVILLTLAGIGPRWQRSAPLRAVVIAACVLALLLSRARTPLLLLVLGAVLLWHRPILGTARAVLARKEWRLVALGALTVAMLAVVLDGHQLAAFLTRNQATRDLLTLTGRTQIWSDALKQWARRPAVGLGYYAGHRLAVPLPPGSEDISNLDNMWVESLVDVGIIGTLCLLALIVSAAFDLFRPQQEDPQIGVRRMLFVVGAAASLINPSLQSYNFAMVILALVVFGAPRVGHAALRPPGRLHGSPREN